MRFLHKVKKYISGPIKISFVVAVILHLILLSSVSGEVLLCNSNINEEKITFKIVNKEDKCLNKPQKIVDEKQKPQVKEKKEDNKDKKEIKETPPKKKKKADIKTPTLEKEIVKKSHKEKKKSETKPENKPEKENKQKPEVKTKIKKKVKPKQETIKPKQKIEKSTKTEDRIKKNKELKSVNKQIYTADQNEIEEKKNNFNPIVRQMQAKNNYIQSRKDNNIPKNKINTEKSQNKQIDLDKQKVEKKNISKNKTAGSKSDINDEEGNSTGKNSEKSKTDNQDSVFNNKVVDFTDGQSGNGFNSPGVNTFQRPVYPSDLRERNVEGKVILELLLNKNGKVEKVKIYKTSGFKQFDQAAREAVAKWVFTPTKKDGKKVRARIRMPIKFKLD